MNGDISKLQEDNSSRVYETKIFIRGYIFSLANLKKSFVEINRVTKEEGERAVATLQKPDGKSDDEFRADKREILEKFFRLSVSLIGTNNVTVFGNDENVFDKIDLPLPLRTVYISNEGPFMAFTGGKPPANCLKIWIHFHKPPLLDPSPLLSEPTPNLSEAIVNAKDAIYFGAAKEVIRSNLCKDRNSFYFIHQKFVYDAGLWFLALPYVLYNTAVYGTKYIPDGSSYAPYRFALLIYGIGIGLLFYRFLYGYMKWAFPLNVLCDNKDAATKHRIIFGAIILGMAGNLASKIVGF